MYCRVFFRKKQRLFRCTGSTYFLHFFHSTSALAIVAVNAIVLYILGKNPKIKTPQRIYRINLAVADLMLGLFGFIPSIYFVTERFYSLATTNKEFSKDFFANIHDELQPKQNSFARFVGFVSWLSFLVSLFTLIAASFDRVIATVVPQRYFKRNSCYVTVGVCVVVWIAAVGNLTEYFDATSYVETMPYFVGEQASRLRSLIIIVIMLAAMLATSSVVLLVLYLRIRYCFD